METKQARQFEPIHCVDVLALWQEAANTKMEHFMEGSTVQGIKTIDPDTDEIDRSVVGDTARWSRGNPVIHSKETRQLLVDALNNTNGDFSLEPGENWDDMVKNLRLR